MKACIAYRDFLISEGIETPQSTQIIDEEKIVRLFAKDSLQNQYEN